MKEDSFIAQCSIHDHMLHISGIDALVVSWLLLQVVAHATSNTLEVQKSKAVKVTRGTKRQAVVEEISRLERKAKLWWRRSVGLRGKPSCGGGDQ